MSLSTRYVAEGRTVADDDGRLLCECVDEATASQVAAALTHMAAYELEHRPLTEEGWAALARTLDEWNSWYKDTHPEHDPDRMARSLGMRQ